MPEELDPHKQLNGFLLVYLGAHEGNGTVLPKYVLKMALDIKNMSNNFSFF